MALNIILEYDIHMVWEQYRKWKNLEEETNIIIGEKRKK
jgi:hypothetical protein